MDFAEIEFLYKTSKFEEALVLLRSFEQIREITPSDYLNIQIYMVKVLVGLKQYNEALELSNQLIYNDQTQITSSQLFDIYSLRLENQYGQLGKFTNEFLSKFATRYPGICISFFC